MTTTQTQIPPWQKVVNFLDKKGKLELWSGVLANQMVDANHREQRKNQEAESAFVRRTAWGEGNGESVTEDDDMHQTILGDVTHPTPVILHSQSPGTIGKVIAGAAIAAGLMGVPLAGIGGYLLNQYLTKPVNTTAPIDASVEPKVGLGFLELEDLTP